MSILRLLVSIPTLLFLLTLVGKPRLTLNLFGWREVLYRPWLYFILALSGLVVGRALLSLTARGMSTLQSRALRMLLAWLWPFHAEKRRRRRPLRQVLRAQRRLVQPLLARLTSRLRFPLGRLNVLLQNAFLGLRQARALRWLGWPWLQEGLLTLLVLVAGLWVLAAFQAAVNPDRVLVGMDGPTFLQDVVAAGQGKWGLYNLSKRLGWPLAAVVLSRLTGEGYLEAAQRVSFLSLALLVPVTYLLARAVLSRSLSLAAALLTLSLPALQAYAVQTTSYALFYLACGLATLAALRAVQGEKLLSYAMLGLTTWLCLQVQIKGLTVLGPVLGLVALFSLGGGLRKVLARGGCFGLPLILGLAFSSLKPMAYTELSWLVIFHREEVHREMPYPWPALRSLELSAPSPLSPYLPTWLKGSELEALSGVLLAPPDADVVGFRQGENQPGRPELRPDTSVPPLGYRLRQNLVDLGRRYEGLAVLGVLLGLLGAGVVGLGLADGERKRKARAGLLLLAALLSVWGSLSLKFHIRYLLQAWPMLAVVWVAGVEGVSRGWLGAGTGGWRLLRRGLVLWLVASLSLSLFTRKPGVWLGLGVQHVRLGERFGLDNQDGDTSQGLALKKVATWLTRHGEPNARFLDCSPMPVWLMAPEDPRWVVPVATEEARMDGCLKVLEEGTSSTPLYYVVSDVAQYRSPKTPDSSLLYAQEERWELVYGVSPSLGLSLEPGQNFYPDPNCVLVFRLRTGG